MQKHSENPGPRAHTIAPAAHGEVYTYIVDKFWIVSEVLDDGKLKLQTRTGKHHTVAANDHRLRKTKWWERIVYRNKLPSLGA